LVGTAADAGGPAEGCYGGPDRAGLVVLPPHAGRPEVLLLGSAHPLTNEGLAEAGNAALALNSLGVAPALIWWRPSLADPNLARDQPLPLVDLLPPWVLPGLAQLVITAIVVALWRGRRLGPVVVEPLPISVPAGETAAGHARLMHAQQARDAAAAHLREDARRDLADRLSLGRASEPGRLIDSVSWFLGLRVGTVGELLYGRDPTDDVGLIRLDRDLAALRAQVVTRKGGR
jgi:hypothetical protein